MRVNIQVVKPPGREEAAQKAISQDASLIPGVRHVVAVASGKGGVGKSTVAANLAVALAQLGHRVGLLDADIYGPSVPMMFGITEKPRVVGNRIYPFAKYGLTLMSLGFILETDTPVIWRGPMAAMTVTAETPSGMPRTTDSGCQPVFSSSSARQYENLPG